MLLCLQPQKQEKMLNLWAYPLPLPSGNGLKDCPIILGLSQKLYINFY